MERVEIVELVDGVCPACGTDYRDDQAVRTAAASTPPAEPLAGAGRK